MLKASCSIVGLLMCLSACSEPVDPYEAYENQKFEMAKEMLEPKVAEGNPKAMTYLAAIYQIEREYSLAELLYLQAARKNYAPAQYNLGMLLHEGVEVDKNTEQAYGWLNLAAHQGHVKASEALTRLGSEITPNQIIQAKKWAANQLEH